MDKRSLSSDAKKYDIVFIGGGPSTIAFFSFLFQHRLADKTFSNINILVIEKAENFGAGCLGKYGINTNTSSEGFVRLICLAEERKSKLGKLGLSPTRKPMKVSKNYNKEKIRKEFEKDDNSKFTPIPLFNNLYRSSSVQTLLSIGNRPAPLTLVGYFLDNLGNYMVDYINTVFNKNILMNKTDVKMVKVYNNEEFGILVSNKDYHETMIKTRCVVMATGGLQNNTAQLYSQIIKLKEEGDVYNSDWILQKEGYMHLYHNILANKKKKVVIIGGSHSGFSSAWIMLNTPSSYSNIKVGDDLTAKVDNKCETDCKCFGAVYDRNWYIGKTAIADQIDIEIKILYREHIRVFYPSEEDAIKDGYTCYDKKAALNKQGRVYPFIGIRGDAKELYKKIIKGEENRVKLIKTFDDTLEYINEADIVIWACGYNTNSIPVKDFRGNNIELFLDETGMIEVDKELRVMNKNKCAIRNLYGIGQGYSTKAPEIINGKKARADSIHLYNTHVSSKLYRSLEGILSKISNESVVKVRRFETTNNLRPRKLVEQESKMNREYHNTKNLLLAKLNVTEKVLADKNKNSNAQNNRLPSVEKMKTMINYGRIISNNILKKANLQ
jgi:lysine/ornithine N-monooxygenase